MELSATPRLNPYSGPSKRHLREAETAYRSIYARLKGGIKDSARITKDHEGRVRLVTSPPVHRTSMTPDHWRQRPVQERKSVSQGAHRRLLLLLLVMTQTALASSYMLTILPVHISSLAAFASLSLFSVLFAWISAGFWTATMGFLLMLLSPICTKEKPMVPDIRPIPPNARTAIVMPICNENIPRLFSGLRATYETLAQTGELHHFDFFILSDSHDPDCRVAEQVAWLDWSQELGKNNHVFYRWRRHRQKLKSGNIADFCRRWGRNYKYFIVLDADSIMSGDCIISLVQRMEANGNVGIIQTSPRAVGRDTLYARMQQFANRVYGPLLIAGLGFWQLGESHYWGHNAIIRVAPFMRHCALSRLPGKGALSGDILSHDFAEAALMRRAGWQVWIAHDLAGSYEEVPSNLLEELQRDRRWCQGNLMNLRLLLIKGLHPVHRAIFIIGAQSYISASLWFISLLLTTGILTSLAVNDAWPIPIHHAWIDYWDRIHHGRAIAIFSLTAAMLFLPKFMGLFLALIRSPHEFGSRRMLILSTALEILLSMMLAPIRMVFHSYFVIASLLGKKVRWRSPDREDAELGWHETLHRLGPCAAIGLAWGLWLCGVNIAYLWWYLPVIGALLAAIPLAMHSSRTNLGVHFRKLGFFRIPEEDRPPREIQVMAQHWKADWHVSDFKDAIHDPLINAIACANGSARYRQMAASTRQHRELAVRRTLSDGIESLSEEQKLMLLNDPLTLALLHDLIQTKGPNTAVA